MAANLKEMMDAANAAVPRITPAQARDMIAQGNTLIVDVRDALEVEKSGKIAGAVNVSRGLLEFRADPDSPSHDKSFTKDKDVIVIAAPAVARRSAARFSKTWAMSAFTTSAGSRTGPKAAARWRSKQRFRARRRVVSAFGIKRTSEGTQPMSAFGGKADMTRAYSNVRF
jgi:rhodanese-related sulfurtransferase